MIIEVWADYVCPWCYLALDRADHLAAAHGAEIRWRPFELHPETPVDGAPVPGGRLPNVARDELREELARAGLPVARRRRLANSARALALSAWASDRPEWPVLHRRLFDACWAEGRDLGDPEELVAIATESGIPRAGAEEAVASGWGRDLLAIARDRALDLGIGATPGWHFGNGVVLVGAHPPAVFERVIGRLGG
ncbi:MAG TPA: DsbA family protein [Acidimicrobiia bacterium]|nr:DsbA family protein [Acidimicrobiia bacterium]